MASYDHEILDTCREHMNEGLFIQCANRLGNLIANQYQLNDRADLDTLRSIDEHNQEWANIIQDAPCTCVVNEAMRDMMPPCTYIDHLLIEDAWLDNPAGHVLTRRLMELWFVDHDSAVQNAGCRGTGQLKESVVAYVADVTAMHYRRLDLVLQILRHGYSRDQCRRVLSTVSVHEANSILAEAVGTISDYNRIAMLNALRRSMSLRSARRGKPHNRQRRK
jgi:hypothetical protein